MIVESKVKSQIPGHGAGGMAVMGTWGRMVGQDGGVPLPQIGCFDNSPRDRSSRLSKL